MNRFVIPKQRRQHNEPTYVCGKMFASKWEAERYLYLLSLQQAGEITDLETQVKYELIPAVREPDTIGKRGGVKKGKVIEKAVNYIADFVYRKDGELIVEDTKGFKNTASAMYKVFVIKRKLMLHIHNIRVKEVRRADR